MDREHGARIVLFPSIQVEPSKSCHDLAADGGQPQNTLYKQPMIQDAANSIPMSVSSKHSSTELTFRSTMPYAGAKNASAPRRYCSLQDYWPQSSTRHYFRQCPNILERPGNCREAGGVAKPCIKRFTEHRREVVLRWP